MRDWSEIHNGKSIDPVSIALPEQLLHQFTDDDAHQFLKDNTMGLVAKGIVANIRPYMWNRATNPPKRSVIHFTDEELKALKTAAEHRAGTWVSTNEALMAHLHPILVDVFGSSEVCAASADAIS